jgi:hypothetical protein
VRAWLKIASRKKLLKTGEAVFIHSAQTVTAYREKACWYGETVSGQTIYSYAAANPSGFSDPSGLLISSIIQNGNNISIVLRINYQNANGESMNGTLLASVWNQAIESAWSNKFGDYNVSVHVVSDGCTCRANTVNVANGMPRENRDWSQWNGGAAENVWGTNSTMGDVIHEAGHLMGLFDKYYQSGPNIYQPYNDPDNGNWVGNIMADQRNGWIQDRNIADILKYNHPWINVPNGCK